MLPIKDENPHPPGFKPKLTYAFIAINVIVFFFEVSVTGEFFEFTNANAAKLFYEWGAVPACIVGESHIAAGSYTIPCPVTPYVTLLSSTFLHGGLMHLGGNMLFLWIFGDNIEAKFGRVKYFVIYLGWGIGAGLIHMLGDPLSPIPAVGASGAISGILGAYLVIFPRARVLTFLMLGFFWRMLLFDVGIFLENASHQGHVFSSILADFSKSVTIFHRWVWCCRRRSCISCTYWRVRIRASGWIYLQKDSRIRIYVRNALWLSRRLQIAST